MRLAGLAVVIGIITVVFGVITVMIIVIVGFVVLSKTSRRAIPRVMESVA